MISIVNFIQSSYPTYEEWKLNYYTIISYLNLKVLILPMRNGNYVTFAYMFVHTPGSYPTYEEWKHIWSKQYFILIKSSYPTYEEWKQTVRS